MNDNHIQAAQRRVIERNRMQHEQVSRSDQWRIDHPNRSYAAEIAAYCFLICLAVMLIFGILQYINARDRFVLQGVNINACARCHQLAIQTPPPLATYKTYRQYHATPADQMALLAELVKP